MQDGFDGSFDVRLRRPSLAKPAIALVAAGAAAVLVVIRVCERSGDGAPIAWHVESGAANAHGYVSIPPTAPTARLVFRDGSDVALAPGSRGRVTETTSVGAEVVIEQGRAIVRVQHREHARWLVDAGPFAVRAAGTEFLVAWSPDAETLEVWMRSGHVELTGPVVGEALSLSAGQHVRARVSRGTVQIDAEAEPPELPEPPVTGTLNPPPAPIEPSTLALPGAGPGARRALWPDAAHATEARHRR